MYYPRHVCIPELTLKSWFAFCLALSAGPCKLICFAICRVWSAADYVHVHTQGSGGGKGEAGGNTRWVNIFGWDCRRLDTIVSSEDERIDAAEAKDIEEVPRDGANPEECVCVCTCMHMCTCEYICSAQTKQYILYTTSSFARFSYSSRGFARFTLDTVVSYLPVTSLAALIHILYMYPQLSLIKAFSVLFHLQAQWVNTEANHL